MAIRNQNALPVYFHSDQGSEYRCLAALLIENNVQVSMSPKSSPFYNGTQESFFGRFKVEFGDPDRFDTYEELIEAIYIQINYYNNRRIHSRLKMPPAVFRMSLQSTVRTIINPLLT
jgi:transposase InsO family protein